MADFNEMIGDKLGQFVIPAEIQNTAGVDLILADGIRDVIAKCRTYKPQLLPLFATDTTQSGATYAVGNMDILSVLANHSADGSIPARFVTYGEYSKAKNNQTTLYDVTVYDPVWTIHNSNIEVLPSTGYTNYTFTYVNEAQTVNASAAASSTNPAGFPVNLHHLIVLYTTIQVLNYIALSRVKSGVDSLADAVTQYGLIGGASQANAPDFVDLQDALDNAQALVDVDLTDDDGAPASESALFWLADEDSDMVSSTLSVAAQELTRANTIMASMDKKIALADKNLGYTPINIQEITGILTLVKEFKDDYNGFFVDLISKRKAADAQQQTGATQ